ncbi:helix-turn-helix domain-containing protein [Planomonospora alba]|uniref:Helix-turn-helix domain-containing protein n=1 Tax=Planomonospora alba TaxID=161354 RepID=A0ABP6MLK7_9ACTN
MRAGLTLAQIQQLPAVVDLVTAGRALGLGRTKAYQLARAGQFPCRVIRIGKSYLVPTTGLLALLDARGGDTEEDTDG